MMANVPELPHHCNSWIVVNRETGDAVAELWSRELAEKVNAAKYEVKTAAEHLGGLNRPAARGGK